MTASLAVLERFQRPVSEWFRRSFTAPTPAQLGAWGPLLRGESTLLLAPTGSGKTLAAFLHCIDRLMFAPPPAAEARCRVIYVSPLKALAVDVERNLRAPIAGVANVASSLGVPFRVPQVAIRSGDTPAKERQRFLRESADILITTPESLYLLLTSNARDALRSVDTVIVDEIHALVPTKRGAHLMLSLERLEARAWGPVQRVGLSATQRPLDEVARFLGGTRPAPPAPPATDAIDKGAPVEFADATSAGVERPVTVVDAGARKPLSLRIELPVEDLARLSKPDPDGLASGAAEPAPEAPSIWSAIHPRLLELIQAHRSTLVFVNSRRIAERLAGALNELADTTLVYAHHGSLAHAQRAEVENRLKAGQVRGLVATSSLELGIDMGAVDLVVQIEAPPSVASGMQRIGRAGHQVGAVSEGVLFPKYRGDLLACTALADAMREGAVEPIRYPRNPLDVLAQQLVALAAMDTWEVDALFDRVRCAAPFARLSRQVFEGVLDLLSGRYASDDFADLRPRLVWDRLAHTVHAREGARRVAVVNGGTIPDRGLYGVFLAGAERPTARVGELDEEMVFESRVGETFVLGASTWRIEEITHDRVLVSPAPAEPGKMPFWRGDSAGRSLELGRRIGALTRELAALPTQAAVRRLSERHGLAAQAAETLVAYLHDQRAAGALPDDRTLVVERCRDALGEWRVCVLSPLGGQVHAPWSMAVTAKVRDALGLDIETMWTNDGFVCRFPDGVRPPDLSLFLPAPEELEPLLLRQLGGTALFAAKFREVAARALLLTKRRPGTRTPLWQLRKRAHDLLQVASAHPTFPMLLETYRECLRDVFDVAALTQLLREVQQRTLTVETVDVTSPSPFAAGLLFGYVANFLYDADAPLAERRAQALTIDPAQLKELLGEAELRELLAPEAFEVVQAQLQRLEPRLHARSLDGVHDLLLTLGDLSVDELGQRVEGVDLAEVLPELARQRRALELPIGAARRWVAAEHASRYRDALGVVLPPGLPDALLEPAPDPLGDLVLRYARTHLPFTEAELSERLGLTAVRARAALDPLTRAGRLVEGAFRPGGTGREWCDPDVLSRLRRKSLAKLRGEIEPVEPAVLGRLVTSWQGVTRKRRGLDALLDAIEKLQGVPLPASTLERDVLPARVEGYQPAELDALLAAGELVWVGAERLGERDGRVCLYLADQLAPLYRPRPLEPELSRREQQVLAALGQSGASFFGPLHQACGGGFPAETVDALWSLVWRGLVTNDALHPLRAYALPEPRRGRRIGRDGRAFRSRRTTAPEAEGRWSRVDARLGAQRPTVTEWSAALAQQLLRRYGVVTREVAGAESIPGGFTALHDVFQALEASGRVRRGYFVSGVGAMQFALPPVLDLLRGLRRPPDVPEALLLGATDPANPYGALLPWPASPSNGRAPMRTVGAWVVLVDGALCAYVARGGRTVVAWGPPHEAPESRRTWRAVAEQLLELGQAMSSRREGLLLSEVNGAPTDAHPLAKQLRAVGFVQTSQGLHLPRYHAGVPVEPSEV